MNLRLVSDQTPRVYDEVAVSTASAIEVFKDESVITTGTRGEFRPKRLRQDSDFGQKTPVIPGAVSHNGPFLNKQTRKFDGLPRESFGLEVVFMPPVSQIARFYREKYRTQDWSELSEAELIAAVKRKIDVGTWEALAEGVSKKVLAALRTPPHDGTDDTPMQGAAAMRA